ncbi:glycosyltransferase family 2 protein [Nocardioides terrae]|uniref:glycosyltransferase family 2 protein n=1 Tax=Nocardioides terrae TaxID=574651 RepID=UPI001587E72D|nr:glycosyltransferase [Nocardioides terrae]
MPAYLEASVVGDKVRSVHDALAAYEGGGRVIVVASDVATATAARNAGADHVIEAGRNGKPAAVNVGVAASDAEIVAVSDANCEIHPVSWPAIAADALRDASVVSAHKSESGGAERLFWAYERLIKRFQGDGGDSLSVVGEFVAFRRSEFRDIPRGELIDDLWLAVDFASRGLRVTVAERITTVEPPAERNDQWERRVRIAEGVLGQQLPRVHTFLRFPAGRRFAVHKFYRLTIGCSAFWAGLLSTAMVRPLGLLPLLGVVTAYCVARYRGALFPRRSLLPWTTVVGMQAVPPAALARIVRKRFRGSEGQPGWKKIAR